jgi:glycosyltransferase involved in cell wall biosynthesis
MNSQPLISIAACTYNGQEYLVEQLDSLVAQTYPYIEIVVVDDASTDETYSILENYAARYPQFKIYRNQHNVGFTENFERAVSLCTGEFIALCDQDDIWLPHKIALQVKAIGNNEIIYHDSEFVHSDGTTMGRKMSDVVNLYRGGEPEVFLFFNCVSGHSILLHRRLLTYALPLPAGYFHDWWLAYVATNTGTIDFIPECLVRYRQHDKSDTNILRLKRNTDKYNFPSVQKIERTKAWLKLCAEFKLNKDPLFVQKVYQAYQRRSVSYVTLSLPAILLKKWRLIFYIQRKSTLSKLNFIYKQMWGSKIKRS